MLDRLAERAAALAADRRVILGIAGCPGSGKSTLAEQLAERLDPDGAWVARVPMDGFHLADAVLDRLGRRGRKGAMETFDAYGYLAMMRRLRSELTHPVYSPGFERNLEQPIAGSIAVDPATRLVITEGNYLLMDTEPWPEIRREMVEVWYVVLEGELRRARLVARHVEFGKSDVEARRWVDEVDEVNARLVASGRGSADLVIDASELEPRRRHQRERTPTGGRATLCSPRGPAVQRAAAEEVLDP